MTRKPRRKQKSNPVRHSGKPRPKARATGQRLRAAAPSDAIPQLMDAGARALGLAIDPAWRDAIALNLRLILRHASLIDDFELLDDAEPAPIFRA